ncbi:MAG TPA: hypothetical protein P5102_12995 [Candidatus Competibacteraceae bacterium]|nr:hypothetical protein [Candidatus Competibacteraceae bacterium]HRZ07039.1 hypothetical protein [Candidatus Competibacteraceae bacterium]HSA46844.1 hypothetical protein [Candidatus Competibacteraceae bacterium]
MSSWQLTSLVVLVVLAAVISGGGWLILRYSQARKQRFDERLLAAKRAAVEKAAMEKATAEQKLRAKSAAINRAAAERLAAKRLAAEQAAAERAAAERAAVEQAIAEWAAAEQAEAERIRHRRASEERREIEGGEERLRAVEDAIAEWVEAEREGNRLAATKTPGKPVERTYTRTEALHQQVRSVAELVEKEVHDLEFIKNRIEADVDFLPIEFRQTIEDWKAGKIFRRSTFDDLKLKFRYKAYSIEDGYEMLYLYNEWLSQQRQKLRVFIRLLGTEVDPLESIQAAIERAERAEQEKYLEMDVDVIFTLRDVRAILEKLIGMEAVLKELEAVCRKRSEQIIAPPWEARGSL